MKKILSIILLFCWLGSNAQYNNEWIDYSKTYYKFTVGKDGVFRIPDSVLQTVGLNNVPAEQFQLWRNGVQVPLYTSTSSGALGANGYIEFWGEMNDGKLDKLLYRNQEEQLSDKWSLYTDTATYFLTVNPAGNNLRFIQTENNVAGNTLPADQYFMYTYSKSFKNRINHGYAGIVGEYVYSSSYDRGEGYTSGDIRSSNPLNETVSNLYPFAGGPDGTFFISAFGNANYNRNVRVQVNNTQLVDVVMNSFYDTKQRVPLPASLLSSGSATVRITNTAANGNDRMVVGKYELTYPRQFNFGNSTNFLFELDANPNGNYLRISNFNHGNTDTLPVLYDLTNLKRYYGDKSQSGILQFVLQPSAVKRNLVLVNERRGNLTAVTRLVPRNFIDYAASGNQGDYMIISHPYLYNGSNGNPVEAYRQYRSSSAGGTYNAKIYDVTQLIDQFAFGIKGHPFSVKNFIKYADDIFSIKPKAVFLIGKGVSYVEAKNNESNSLLEKLNMVPPFGYPASDNLLASRDTATLSKISIGRLSVVAPNEVEIYLNKIKEYETIGKSAPNTIAGRGWMKNIVHAIGGGNASLTNQIGGYMNELKNIIEDTLYGGNVRSYSKSGVIASQLSLEELQNLFAEGIGILNYFGHSSSSNLEFNIEKPTEYNNQGKYPLFLVNGCLAGDIFNLDINRFHVTNTLSEDYVLANQRGGIGFIASSHYGIVSYLNSYLQEFYKGISGKSYGLTVGEMLRGSFESFMLKWGTDFFARLHAEEITLHGDPAVRIYMEEQPDYVVEDQYIQLPPVVSVSDSEFNVSIDFFNIGKVISDSVNVTIQRQLPQGEIVEIAKVRMVVKNINKLTYTMPINPAQEKGENKIIVTLDSGDEVDEISEFNNYFSKTFYIIENEVVPVYPYKFSIVNKNNINFFASTANPLDNRGTYVMEIDTTQLFNSPYKKTTSVDSRGGLIEFNPNLSFTDSIVYYWRVASRPDPGKDYFWQYSSFIYLPESSEGFNQSHYYQHIASVKDGISLVDGSRSWEFNKITGSLFVRNGVYPTASPYGANYINSIDGKDISGSGCNFNEIIIQVINPITFEPWQNNYSGATGLYNSIKATCGADRIYNFQYFLNNSTSRKHAMDFLDIIPDGYYVIAKSNAHQNAASNTFADVWKADTTLFGSGNSLYHKLYDLGFTNLDSFSRPRAWSFVFKKNDNAIFAPRPQLSINQYDLITMALDCPIPDTVGYITSPKLGPAREWKNFTWSGHYSEDPSHDKPSIDIIGVRQDNSEHTLYNLAEEDKQVDLSSVDVSTFPYLRLKMRNTDTVASTPYQLDFWRLNYVPYPEGAIAPNIYFEMKDTVETGEIMKIGVAFKNISDKNFDSLKVKLVIIDKNNVQHELDALRRKPLVANDTIRLEYMLDTKKYPGLNTIAVFFNPDYDQNEEYLMNNFLHKSLYVRSDNLNPLMDVTFDGVHILNNDIVSARPHILIKLKDDSRHLLLDDTSLFKISIRYPNGTIRQYSFNSDTLRFTPAVASSGRADNTATVDFHPDFLEDGDYELIISARDKSGNASGQQDYRIGFKIINKPMISNMLNYPNPFTTSTAFVFTLTGSEIPQNIRIQVLTITGKIVREITKEELGNIRIGRNITEFKWDGTDQYGQRLANGVYLYRVITHLNGKSLDKYTSDGDNTDRFFNKGYGKMYLMR